MRILILGAGGMLGHKLLQCLQVKFDAWGTVRSNTEAYAKYGIFDLKRMVSGVDAFYFDSIIRAVAKVRPDWVINCIGIVKQLEQANDPLISIKINSLLPHRLAHLCQACGSRLIHISTDCVFSGSKGQYSEEDVSDAVDLYGRSKYLGEVSKENCLTLRTSIIGRELNSSKGLVEWFLQPDHNSVNGFTKAIYSGLTTNELSVLIGDIIKNHSKLSGLYNVASNPISKYELLCLLKGSFGASTIIDPVDEPQIDMSLVSTKFSKATGYIPPAWSDMVEQMAKDAIQYTLK